MESARPRKMAASRGLGLREGSGRRALAPSAPVSSVGLSAAKVTSSSGRRANARVQEATARLNGSLFASTLLGGLRLLDVLRSGGGMTTFLRRVVRSLSANQ